jgi:cytochrome oxidase assembly protein ShyY1
MYGILPLVEPRFLVAEHDMRPQPPRLFYFDPKALSEYWKHSSTTSSSVNSSSSNSDSPSLASTGTILVTQVAEEAPTVAAAAEHTTSAAKPKSSRGSSRTLWDKDTVWPVAPPVERVGEPKLMPAVHAGYAVTWYGMSVAGMYMMRIMMTRGRVK